MAMPVTLLDTSAYTRDQWLQLRKRGIGGSDVAAICGLSRWKTPMHVYLDKIGETPPEEAQSEAAYWGTVMEGVLADEFSRRTGWETRVLSRLMVHPVHEWAIANIDRLIVDNERPEGEHVGVLECKTASEYLLNEWTDGKIPDYYLVQLQWYLNVSGLTWGYFSTLVGGNKYLTYRVDRDDELIEQLMQVCGDFWQKYVLAKQPPQFDGSNASSDLVKKLYPTSDGRTVELDEDAGPLIKQLLESKRIIKEAETLEAEAENRLKAMMESREVAYFRGKPAFTWRAQNDTRLDSKSLQKDYPDIYERYLSSKQIRKFLPKLKEVVV